MDDYNRDNVNKIKKIILVMIFILCIVPTILCIVLMLKLSKLENRFDEYISSKAIVGTNGDALAYNEKIADKKNKNAELDLEAYDDIEKGVGEVEMLTLKEGIDEVNKSIENASQETVNDVEKNANLNGKRVYLTFDDGPSKNTKEILDILDEENVKATFFVVKADEEYYEEYQDIVARGNTLAMHSYSHEYKKMYADIDAFKEDVDSIHDLLYDITGVDVKYYRFPGGSSNRVSKVDIQDCIDYLDEKGYVYFDWNSLNGDAVNEAVTPEELNENIMKYVRSNSGDSVVLMHDFSGRHATVEALPDLIHTLKEEGYEILPIDDDTPLIRHVKDANDTPEE